MLRWVFCWVLIAMFLVLLLLHDENKRLKIRNENLTLENFEISRKIEVQNESINGLVSMQNQKEKQLIKVEEDAKKLRIQSDMDAQKLFAQKVPKNCAKSIEWGGALGSTIYECWVAEC